MSSLFNLIVYYGGNFVHVPQKVYSSNKRKIYKNVDLHSMTVGELKRSLSEIVGEFDSLFYKRDGKTVAGGIKLLSSESKSDVIKMGIDNNGTIDLLVYHCPNLILETEKEDNLDEKEVIGVDEEGEEEGNETDEQVDEESQTDRSCSDDEFNEIRKRTRVERKKILHEEYEYDMCEDVESGEDNLCSDSSGSKYDVVSSEEDDDEICYAEPPYKQEVGPTEEIFNVKTPVKEIKWKLGLIFTSKKQLKTVIMENSMATGRPYRYATDDKKRLQIVCAKGCPFKMWACYIKENESWQIRTLLNEHNCVWTYRNKLVTVKYLVGLFGDRIRKNPNWKLGEMQEEIKRVLKVDVCEAKCCRVRKQALSGVEQVMKEHYAKVRRFGGEILRSNRNNTVKISTTRLQEGDENRFHRMYICYNALKNSWKNTCRPILGLDGCFLKTVTGGQLLTAVGRDGNNCILPVAMALVETESYDSWKWFLELLIEDLGLDLGTGKTLISDQQKGLDKAIRELLPHVEHRFCTRHLYNNLRKVYPSSLVQTAFYNASNATHPQAFKTAMKEFEKISQDAANKMKELDPAVWSKAYFSTHSRTDSTENNISECFNSWIIKARYMPLIDMLTEIHDMLMTRMHEKRDEMSRRNCVIVPKIKEILDLAIEESASYTVLWDGRDNYNVKGKGSSVSVNLEQRTCSCRIWDLTGVPCCHAVTAIQQSRQNPVNFVDKWFTKETYLKTYSYNLEVINGEEFWEDDEGDTILPPVIVKSLRGRPKRLRRREGWEGGTSSRKVKKQRMSGKGRKMHCAICREEGHNRNNCTNKPANYEPPQPKPKKGKASNKQQNEEADEEVQLQDKEQETGEAELMDDLLRDMEEDQPLIQPPPPPQTSEMKFMPTPSLKKKVGTSCTPPASTPPTTSKPNTRLSQVGKKQGPVTRNSASKSGKQFIAPRKKK